jgi:cell fate (sporulation/competence/biofilm development) regulator YmcA (YheA/YmcA/DUF963 family)
LALVYTVVIYILPTNTDFDGEPSAYIASVKFGAKMIQWFLDIEVMLRQIEMTINSNGKVSKDVDYLRDYQSRVFCSQAYGGD